MRHIKLLLVLLIIIGSVFTAKASHYMGGEITWKCIPAGQPNAGKFIFTMKVYRECGGITFGTSQALTTTSPVGSIQMNIVPGWPKDLSPQCDIGSGTGGNGYYQITCVGAESSGADNTGAVSEYLYKSAPVQLNGVPPITGWSFNWGSCCRNPSTNVSGQPGWKLRANMFPYNSQNTYPCFDNSPTFAEVARTVISAGYPFEYNHNAYDEELDVLHFEWGQPLVTMGTPVTYNPGYSYTSPLPGPAQNANNVAATIEPNIGTISFTSYNTGAFVTSVKVTAYKCGQKVAEIWRDIQVVMLDAGINNPPVVNPPLNGGTSFSDTVYAGEVVTFALNGQDIEFLPNGNPQTMEIQATGQMFGSYIPASPPAQATMSQTTGCLQPPCATLTPAPHSSAPLTGMFGIQTQFYWQTECEHLAVSTGCNMTSNVFNFVMKVMDNYCPAPAINYNVVSITVLPKPQIPSPDVQCISVADNGDVSLEWSLQEDSMTTFDSYRIYYSAVDTGPFVEIDSIFNYNVLNYTHVGANAQDSIKYYIVETKSGCPGYVGATDADTFATINVEVAFDNVNMEADVNWNPISDPILSSSTGWYQIYRKKVNTAWEFVDSTQNTFFSEPMKQCDDEVQYYVTIMDTMIIDTVGATPHSCTSKSSVGKDLFYDYTAPAIPTIDTVSIDKATGKVNLSWDVNSDGDTGGYIIYLVVGGVNTPIDTVYGINNNSYIDLLNDACANGFNTYVVAALDTCVPPNVSPYSIEARTMSLSAVKDICDDKITLTWTPYINMASGVGEYRIFASENGGPDVLLNSSTPTSTTYEHVGLNNGSIYDYSVVAVSTDGSQTSTSCMVNMLANKPNQPNFIYVRKASVFPNAGIDLTIHTDTSAKVIEYVIERSINNVTWEAITSIPADYTNPTLTYHDAGADVNLLSYYYRAIVIDSCGNNALTSAAAKSMLLKSKASDSLYNDISWTPYQGFDGTPTIYEVFRAADGVWDPNPLITLPANQTYFRDDISQFKDKGGVFAYIVLALEGPGVNYSFNDTTKSNSSTVVQKPRLYIPTAFNPNSNIVENRTFVPQGVFINSSDYLFIVYNRWGAKVYESNVVGEGWDGTFEGSDAPGGVYTYFVRFTASNGVSFEDRGTVTMIR